MVTNKFFASETLKKTQSELNLQYKGCLQSNKPKMTFNFNLDPSPLSKYFSSNIDNGILDFNKDDNSNFLDIFDKNMKNSRSISRKNGKSNNLKPK